MLHADGKFASLTSHSASLTSHRPANSGGKRLGDCNDIGHIICKTAVTLSSTPAGFQTTEANETLANIGFIVSLCIVHQCAIYRNESIIRLDITENYDITENSAEAFLGATNIEVCLNNMNYSRSS